MTQPYQFAQLNGATIHYDVRGSGPALVLIHAGICDLRMWEAQMDALSQHYQVVRLDMRGYGQTAPVEGHYTRHGDLLALLDHLGIARVHLLGCSMGGTAAIDFALAYPERVAALILVCSSPSGYVPDADPPPGWDELVAAFKAGELEKVAEMETALWVEGLQRTSDQVDPAMRQLVYEMNLNALQNEVLELGEVQPLEPPAIERLADVDVPTLVIATDLDLPDIGEVADLMATQIAQAKKMIIQGAAHLPNMEKPDIFNQIVLDFLEQVEVSRS